jgi:hypothetical protein
MNNLVCHVSGPVGAGLQELYHNHKIIFFWLFYIVWIEKHEFPKKSVYML